MERISLTQTEGRGRNGWFRAREALVLAIEERVDLDVVSSRPSFPGPVRLELAPDDAAALANGLIRAAAQSQPEILSRLEAPVASFPDTQAAVAALDAFLEALTGSAWIRPEELQAITRETTTLREMVTLSGGER